jgi:hypothetical protein
MINISYQLLNGYTNANKFLLPRNIGSIYSVMCLYMRFPFVISIHTHLMYFPRYNIVLSSWTAKYTMSKNKPIFQYQMTDKSCRL